MNVLYIICFKTHLSKKLSHSSNARSPSPRSRLRLRLHTPPQRVVRRKAVRCRRSTIEANDRTRRIERERSKRRCDERSDRETTRRGRCRRRRRCPRGEGCLSRHHHVQRERRRSRDGEDDRYEWFERRRVGTVNERRRARRPRPGV
jgi:hypothetical protein